MSNELSSQQDGDQKNLRDALWKIQHCQFEDLKFADAKAGALLTLSAALAAFTNYFKLAGDVHLPGNLLVAEYVFAAATVICSIGAIIPRKVWRYRQNPGPLTHFTGIANHEDPKHYLEKIASVDTDFDMELAQDIYRMAHRATIKYKFVWFAVCFVASELTCFLAAIAIVGLDMK